MFSAIERSSFGDKPAPYLSASAFSLLKSETNFGSWFKYQSSVMVPENLHNSPNREKKSGFFFEDNPRTIKKISFVVILTPVALAALLIIFIKYSRGRTPTYVTCVEPMIRILLAMEGYIQSRTSMPFRVRPAVITNNSLSLKLIPRPLAISFNLSKSRVKPSLYSRAGSA